MAHNAPGRHRAGRYNPFSELKLIAKDAAKPAAKGAAVLAATGGVIAGASSSASAAPAASPVAAPAATAGTTAAAPAPALSAAPAPQIVKTYKRYTYKRYTSRYTAKRYAYKRYTSRYNTRYSAKRYAYKRYTSRYNTRYTSYRSTSRNYARYTGSSAGNPFAYGECTWGAFQAFKNAKGYYPHFYGNAKNMPYTARAAGYRVGYTPRVGSIAIMQPGVHGTYGLGHAAYVTGVRGNRVTLRETGTSAGWGVFRTRTVSNVGGMAYIYA